MENSEFLFGGSGNFGTQGRDVTSSQAAAHCRRVGSADGRAGEARKMSCVCALGSVICVHVRGGRTPEGD